MPQPDEGWNHNRHYHEVLLNAAPRPCGRALDVGCGIGAFARRLAAVAAAVDAIDRDAAAIAASRRASGHLGNVQFDVADFLDWRPDRPYDFIAMIAVLHHLPFDAALMHAAQLLRPGGVLAVLGLDRATSILHEAARSSLAYPVSVRYRLQRGTSPVGAPLAEPTMTLAEIRRQARPMLPAATIRRHILWRYSLIWCKPASSHAVPYSMTKTRA